MLSTTVLAEVKVIAQAPQVVAEDEQFHLQYVVNSNNISSISTLKDIPEFKILYGPSKSTSFSFQSINGKQTQNSTTTYTYTLLAKKKGTYTLPKMTVTVAGKQYTSNVVQVKVVDNANASSHSQQGGRPNAAAVKSSDGMNISNKDLFIAVTANKSVVYEQEPILLTYRVYSKVNLTQLSGKMPDLKGFMVKEVPLPQQKSFSVGEFEGENYYTTVWSQYVMFPQQTGKMTIPKIQFDGVVVLSNPNIDLLDAFFNGTSSTIQKKKTIIAPSLDVTVKALPEKPDDFSGGVGDFRIKATAKNPKLKENETLQIQLVISGSGNVDLIKTPTVQFPSGFDTYDPKTTNNTKIEAGNINGNLVIDYLAIPQNKGTYTIPPIKLTYFDTQSYAYKTIQTDPLTIEVLKGEKNIYAEKQREILAQKDIRYLKSGEVKLREKKTSSFWNTKQYWLSYFLLLILFAAANAFLYWRGRAQGMGGRSQNANKIAKIRLKKAHRLLLNQQAAPFYEETLNALSGFVCDRLNIPVAEMSKDRMRAELQASGVSQEAADALIGLLDECEFMRYAGSREDKTKMDEIYQQAIKMISSLDALIKKKKRK